MSTNRFYGDDPPFDDAFEEGESFLAGQYHAKNKNREKGVGNFVAGPNGDMTSARSLSIHARKRIKERGTSISDALKGKPKSGAIISDRGKVITVIPEAWKKNAGMQQKAKPKKHLYSSNVPNDKTMPKGHCILSLSIPSNAIGAILGKNHANIKQMIQGCPCTQYDLDGNRLTIWGPEEQVKRLMKNIDARVNASISGETGPPVPPGQVKRRIIVAKNNIGHVLGKEKQNLVKMRKDHPTGAINFNGQTGEVYVFGEASEVNKVCDEIASITLMANKMRAKKNARKERVGKASHKEKNHKYEKDLKKNQKAGTRSLKSKQKQNAYGEMTTAEVKIYERAALGNKKAKKKMKKRKELQKKKMT